ncbi:MAG: SlyX family protein [Gammaproteobacteria bacterium]|nr:SlyX family protein [Gammaproteobacteria bacterium]NNF66473.1 SlyX family protein [Gammaproteobacteria bacterium]
MSELDERITELENRIAFLEHASQQMSDLIYNQQKQIDRHVRDTARQIENLQQSMESGDSSDETPPHY